MQCEWRLLLEFGRVSLQRIFVYSRREYYYSGAIAETRSELWPGARSAHSKREPLLAIRHWATSYTVNTGHPFTGPTPSSPGSIASRRSVSSSRRSSDVSVDVLSFGRVQRLLSRVAVRTRRLGWTFNHITSHHIRRKVKTCSTLLSDTRVRTADRSKRATTHMTPTVDRRLSWPQYTPCLKSELFSE